MRLRDFGSPSSVSISDTDESGVVLKSVGVSEYQLFLDLEHKNFSSIDPYAVSSDNIKVLSVLGVYLFNTPVGLIKLWKKESESVSISCWIDSDYRRQGIAKKSIKLLVDDFFTVSNDQAICAYITDENLPSINLFKDLGFTNVGFLSLKTSKGYVVHNVYEKRRS